MTRFDRVDFSGFGETLEGVGTRGLEQPVARSGIVACRRRPASARRVANRRSITANSSISPSEATDASRFQRETTGKNRQAPQHRALRLREQIVAPVERRAKRLLARLRRVRSTG